MNYNWSTVRLNDLDWKTAPSVNRVSNHNSGTPVDVNATAQMRGYTGLIGIFDEASDSSAEFSHKTDAIIQAASSVLAKRYGLGNNGKPKMPKQTEPGYVRLTKKRR